MDAQTNSGQPPSVRALPDILVFCAYLLLAFPFRFPPSCLSPSRLSYDLFCLSPTFVYFSWTSLMCSFFAVHVLFPPSHLLQFRVCTCHVTPFFHPCDLCFSLSFLVGCSLPEFVFLLLVVPLAFDTEDS